MSRRKRRTTFEFDMIPVNLIDLFLVILIFFITTTTFLKVKNINLELPVSESSTRITKTEVVSLNISKDGRFFLDSIECDYKDLIAALKKLKKENKKNTLYQIGADRNSKHSDFIKAIDALSIAGISEVSIATEEIKGV